MRITYDDILTAFQEASRHGGAAAGTRYALMDPRTGKTYPPKQILSLIIEKLRPSVGKKLKFFGGKGLSGANRVFKAFGFPVGNKEGLLKSRVSKERPVRKPSTQQLLKTLFSQKWRLLPATRNEISKNITKYPGVYMVAYSDRRLQGTPIREKDVFYVGMTCEGGLNSRLGQFLDSVMGGRGHGPATRFYRIWLGRESYNPQARTKLYFVYVPVRCVTVKPWRAPKDLRKLGKVVELEYAAIAQVKSEIGHEPLLNWK